MKQHKYQFSEIALDELNKVQDDFWEVYPGRDLLFTRKLEALVERLRLFPEMGEARHNLGQDIRCVPLWRYLILYRFLDDVVIIEHIIHGARDVATILKRS